MSGSQSGGWLVGVDIGGTFTDVVGRAADGTMRRAKVPTHPADPVASIAAALAAIGVAPAHVAELIHGTTRVTNAIVEGRLEPVTLIATDGFEDIVEIGRQSRRELYRLDALPKPTAPVPRARRIALGGRMGFDGAELSPLPDAEAARAADAAVAAGTRAVAVALLHAYANPAHERAVAAHLRGRVAHLALSHAVTPEAREYERTIATVLTAAVMPLAAEYLARLTTLLPPPTRLWVMHSAGGMTTPSAGSALPLGMALSGPAAGVAAAAAAARAAHEDLVLSFDMGGTTTDVALIRDGAAQITADARLADQPLRQPMVAIESIGAGGGSVIRYGPGGLSVGPESAGAVPGPACYARGGTAPTVCDANAVLGYLNPRRRLGGAITLDVARAHAALAPLAAKLRIDAVTLALGVLRVADATMARALNRITVERGVDGRGATLLAFGGMGPIHAAGLARAYGIARVLVPAESSAFSALGCLAAELSQARQRTVRIPGEGFDDAAFAAARVQLAEDLAGPLRAEGTPLLEEVALVRYRGQSYAVEVPLSGPANAAALGAAFEAQHRLLFGFASGEAWELQGLRTRARVPRVAMAAPAPPAAAPPVPFAVDPCWFAPGLPTPTPRFARESLAPPHRIAGPAVIEDDWSTILVPPGWAAAPDLLGNILLTPEPA